MRRYFPAGGAHGSLCFGGNFRQVQVAPSAESRSISFGLAVSDPVLISLVVTNLYIMASVVRACYLGPRYVQEARPTDDADDATK